MTAAAKFINATDKGSSAAFGVNQLKTGKIIKIMSRSSIGREVLARVQADDINLVLSIRNDVPKNLMGGSSSSLATAYVKNTQGYEETVLTLIHEGVHALGIGGSRRAEALARLAEVSHKGGAINRAAMRQVLQDIRSTGAYDHLQWKMYAQSIYFKDSVTF
ncbi:hypothetical protein [Iningainema tapete]|uniref:Uncharacterized protein n=1 Tax=Iningainema tapete BLCC-T55 TaxID=2748662 RepID=A0A8J6XSG7_9CYAN|nr:hypothetical protein [Iningainema tapete]MBD2777514.1 hypothetical protein [Iningainema tapete BLCC-T55]